MVNIPDVEGMNRVLDTQRLRKLTQAVEVVHMMLDETEMEAAAASKAGSPMSPDRERMLRLIGRVRELLKEGDQPGQRLRKLSQAVQVVHMLLDEADIEAAEASKAGSAMNPEREKMLRLVARVRGLLKEAERPG